MLTSSKPPNYLAPSNTDTAVPELAIAGRKLVAYARRSHRNDGDNWETDQSRALAAYATRALGRAPDLFVFDQNCKRIFDRPGLQELLKLASSNELAALIVPDKTTIASMPRPLAEFMSRFERFNVAVHALSELRRANGSKRAKPPGNAANDIRVGRIVGYAKCELSGSTISPQYKLLQSYSECTTGHRLDDFYCDAGGRLTWERPGFRALMQDVEASRIATIVVADLSRLGTSPLLDAEFKDRCQAKNVSIVNIVDVPLPHVVARPRRPLPTWRSDSDRALHFNSFAWQRLASVRKHRARKR